MARLLVCRDLNGAEEHSEFGPVLGFAIPFDEVQGQQSHQPGLTVGLEGLYQFDKGDFRGWAFDYGLNYTLAANVRFSNVPFSGVTGRFSENLGILNLGGGIRYFLSESAWRPFLGVRPGFYFFHRFGTSFRDRFGNPLPNPNLGNNFNFGLKFPLGLSWKPSFRWDLSFGFQVDVIFRNAGAIPGITFPLTVKIAF